MCEDLLSSSKILSIIIPIFNDEETIAKCLSSIMYSFKNCVDNIEIILINDGSTDNFREKINAFLNYQYISIINQENEGVSVARNVGLINAKGKYVWFVDADDSINKFNGKEFLNNLIEKDADLYLFGFKKYLYLKEGKQALGVVKNQIEHSYTREDFSRRFTKIFSENEFNAPWNKIYKLSIIRKHHIKYISKMKSGEDAAFNCEYMMYCEKIYITPQIFYNYFISEENASYYGNYYSDLKFMSSRLKNMVENMHISDGFLNNKYLEMKKGFIDNLYLKSNVSWKFVHSEIQNYNLGSKINFFKLSGKNKLKYLLCVNILSVYVTYLKRKR